MPGCGVAVVHPDLGRIAGRPLEPVALHEEARHRAAGDAREHEPRRRTEHADLERVGDAAAARRTPAPTRSPCRARRAGTALAGEYAHRRGHAPSRVATATTEAAFWNTMNTASGREQESERPPAGLEVALPGR